MPTIRRGRKARTPKTELGIFIQKHLDAIGLTRANFAKSLEVSSPTIARILNGDTKVIHSQQIRFESISNVLRLNEMERRTLLKIIGTTGFALATGTKALATLKYKIDLDLAEDHAQTLQQLLNQGGDVLYVLNSAKTWYNTLMKSPSYTKDIRLAATQIRFGLLLGSVQEVTLPWYERPSAIQTYDAIENDIICRFNLNTFQQEYAILHSHRAPLYRDLHNYDESRKQFMDGIYWTKSIDNPALRIALFDHVHISATLGQETQWRYQLEEAHKEAHTMSQGYRDTALIELSYLEAEGYKRLAFNPHKELPRSVRINYAQQGLKSFLQSQLLMKKYNKTYSSVAQISTEQTSMGHSLLANVDQAQCLVLVDPEGAIHLIQQIWDDVSTYYPSLVAKMQRTLDIAQGQLQTHKINPLLLFTR